MKRLALILLLTSSACAPVAQTALSTSANWDQLTYSQYAAAEPDGLIRMGK